MRCPARHIVGHVLWTRDGSVWAVWSVQASTYRHLDRRSKHDLLERTRAQLRTLGSEALLLSLCARTEPADVVRRMVDDVDLDASPEWAEACEATLDDLDTVDLYQRRHYLAVALPKLTGGKSTGLASLFGGSLGAARGTLAEAFGIPSPPVPTAERDQRIAQAHALGDRLRRTIPLTPATPEELHWIYERAPLRGLDEPPPPTATEDRPGRRPATEGQWLRTPSLVALGEATFFEGGQSGDPRGRSRRYLKSVTEAGESFQAFAALSDMPTTFTFPDGAEWFAGSTTLDFPVDWCARIRPVSNADAQVKAKRQARQLSAQIEEYDGETAGTPATLTEALYAIDDERAQLAANPGDPELETSIIFAVWADTLAECEARADALRDTYGASEYILERPTGGQLALYGAMLPGSTTPRVARDYVQYLMPHGLAAGMPWADSDIGDPVGGLIGYNLDHGTLTPVLLDPGYGPRTQRSGSVGCVGDLGSGKSYLLKLIGWNTVARGGRLVILDRTSRGEWLDWAAVAPGATQAVRVGDEVTEFSLDPLRMFTGPARTQTALGFLQLLTGASGQDIEGIALREAVKAVADRDGRLVDVIDELNRKAAEDLARGGVDRDGTYRIARQLEGLRTEPLAELVFSDAPPLALSDADAIVFHAPNLALPDEKTLANPHLAKKMLNEQIFSMALVYLIAAIGQQVIFSDPGVFAALVVDEAYILNGTPQGKQLTSITVRDGRKHNAALFVAGQHIEHLGDEETRGLLRNRFAFRQSQSSALLSLGWLGLDPDEAAVDRLTAMSTRQCLFKDIGDRAGLLEVASVPLERLVAGFDTNATTKTPSQPATQPRTAAPVDRVTAEPDRTRDSTEPEPEPETDAGDPTVEQAHDAAVPAPRDPLAGQPQSTGPSPAVSPRRVAAPRPAATASRPATVSPQPAAVLPLEAATVPRGVPALLFAAPPDQS